jgi:hypothetical protein
METFTNTPIPLKHLSTTHRGDDDYGSGLRKVVGTRKSIAASMLAATFPLGLLSQQMFVSRLEMCKFRVTNDDIGYC